MKYSLLFCALFGFMFGGCQAPVILPFTIQDYQSENPIILPVSNIKIINQTTEFPTLPHIENQLPITPVEALTKALSNRFKAEEVGLGNLTLTITEASLIQKKHPEKEWYILDNMEYILGYRLIMTYQNHGQTQSQEIVGWEKQIIPQNSTIIKKEQAWQNMLNNMIDKVVQKIESDILIFHK